MCELLALSCSRKARTAFALDVLAARGAADGRTRDGWGAAFYDDNDVAIFREPVAAGDSPLIRFLQRFAPATTLAISHIRRATRGAISLPNTQPFAREVAGGMHVFAHNGDLPGIEQSAALAFDRYRPIGTTDSEHAFCALLERMGGLWASASAPPPVEMRLAVVAGFAADLRRFGPANFLYADGDVLFAHGHRRIQSTGVIEPPGLHLLLRQCPDADEFIHASGLSIEPGFREASLIASVPLTDDKWRPLVEGEIVVVSGGRVVAGGAP